MARRTRSASVQPATANKRRRLAQEPSVIELIELTDSAEDSDPSPTPSKSPNPMAFFRKKSKTKPAPAVGSSSHVQPHQQQGGDVPLFIPSGDEEEASPSAQGTIVAPGFAQLPPPVPAQVDSPDEYIVRVLEVVPDVQPAHALMLIEQFMKSKPENVVEFVLHALLEAPSYPKIDSKGKHKRSESGGDPNDRGTPKPKVDYTSKERMDNCGPHYFECALEQLMADFPRIPKPHIRVRLLSNRFYAPTYMLLAEELEREHPPFRLKLTKSAVGKGKARQDPEFDKEREWVLLKVAEQATKSDVALAASVNQQQCEENGEGIECGCCFSEYPFDQMIQCPEAHLFCKSCMTSYASNLLGEHNPNIICMDQSGCKLPFPESELCRFLSSKLLELYFRVKQRKEIEAAGLDNLEECPFCEYRCVIENEMEKLFRCENASCNAITCRACKRPDHLPKSCKEADEDKHLDAQHVIEEAMTQALMRNCPKCQKSFIKEMGCNKMTCPNCHTISCYICRKIIQGYDHFSNSSHSTGKGDTLKCNLWDPVEQRHAEEVSEAAKRALAELRQSRPEVNEAHLKVDIPATRPAPGAAPALALNGGPALPMMGHLRLMGPGRADELAPRVGGVGGGVGGARDPFVFGAGQPHMFAPLAMVPPAMVPPARGHGAPPFQLGLGAPPFPAEPPPLPPARGRRRGAQRAGPAPPLLPAPALARVQPVPAAGGRRGRRRGR